MRQTASSDRSIDNDHVRVTAWTFAPGERTGEHRHELPYVVVPVTAGRLRIEAGNETSQFTLEAGRSYFRQAGVEHDVINDGEAELVFVEIELKECGLGEGSPARTPASA